MKPRALTLAETEDIVSRYQRGQSLAFICLALNRSRPVVKAALEARGITVRKPGDSNWGWSGRA